MIKDEESNEEENEEEDNIIEIFHGESITDRKSIIMYELIMI